MLLGEKGSCPEPCVPILPLIGGRRRLGKWTMKEASPLPHTW